MIGHLSGTTRKVISHKTLVLIHQSTTARKRKMLATLTTDQINESDIRMYFADRSAFFLDRTGVGRAYNASEEAY